MAGRVAELRYLAFQQALAEEREVVFWADAFEGDAQKVTVSFEDALRVGVTLSMTHAGNIGQHLQQRVVNADGILLGRVKRQQALHLYMAAKAGHLVANGMLKSQHNGHGDNHNSQADGHANGGNTNGWQ